MQSRWQKCALPHCHWDGQPSSIAWRLESPALVVAIVAPRTRRICEQNRRCLTSSTAQVWRWALVRLDTCPRVRSASFQKHPVLDSAKAQKWSWVTGTMPHANVNALGKCRIPECLRKINFQVKASQKPGWSRMTVLRGHRNLKCQVPGIGHFPVTYHVQLLFWVPLSMIPEAHHVAGGLLVAAAARSSRHLGKL